MSAARVLEEVWRTQAASMRGALMRRLGDFDRAEDALQEALAQATGDDERARIRAALAGLHRAHVETIHAFAAGMLRERPRDQHQAVRAACHEAELYGTQKPGSECRRPVAEVVADAQDLAAGKAEPGKGTKEVRVIARRKQNIGPPSATVTPVGEEGSLQLRATPGSDSFWTEQVDEAYVGGQLVA